MPRRDLLVRNPPGPAYQFPLPVIPGSDGAGVRRDTGEEVVIYPAVGWGASDEVPDPQGFRFVGGPLDGTFAEFFDHFLRGKVEFGSWFQHVRGWWERRYDPNVLFLTYEELTRLAEAAPAA